MKIILMGIVVPIFLLIAMLIATLILPSAVIVDNIGQIYQALLAITIIPIVVLLTKATKGYLFVTNVKLKNAREEFEKIYNQLQDVQNDDLTKLKNFANIFAMIDIALASITVLGIAFIKMGSPVISESVDRIIKLLAVFSPMMLAFMLFVGSKHRKRYKRIYKEQIISRFVRLVDSNLKYSLYGRVGDDMKNKYLVSDFETKAFNRFESEDYVDGKINGKIYAEISEINVDYAFKKKKRRYREDLFQGMFAVIRSEHDIGAWVKVLRNKFRLFASRNRIEMDDTAFEKIFDVYTDNKAVAHQLMQKEMISTFLQFYLEYDLRFEVMFKENIIFMRFFTPKMFSPKLFGNSLDKKTLYTYYNIIRFIAEVSKEVNETTAEARREEENKKIENKEEQQEEKKEQVQEVKEEAKVETVTEEKTETKEAVKTPEPEVVKEEKTEGVPEEKVEENKPEEPKEVKEEAKEQKETEDKSGYEELNLIKEKKTRRKKTTETKE